MPIDVNHYFVQVFGFRFNDFAYLTDVKTIDDEEIEDALEANIPLGAKSLGAAIEEYKEHISFRKK